MSETIKYAKEYWTGESRDGVIVDGDGYHYFEFDEKYIILKAFEVYERDDGEAIATPLPELKGVDWLKDNGQELLDALEKVTEAEFQFVEELALSR